MEEALEYQKASSEVLEVISRSPDRVQPVLDAILDVVARIMRHKGGYIALLNEETGFLSRRPSAMRPPKWPGLFGKASWPLMIRQRQAVSP
ncbi:hypothetical protein [Sulfitobacter sediminilitoris]|uniref:hypothetical protein n=1 Tax=Sulfitobacter sediminilitoris TaxID=2698830 RepID=UPI003622F15A